MGKAHVSRHRQLRRRAPSSCTLTLNPIILTIASSSRYKGLANQSPYLLSADIQLRQTLSAWLVALSGTLTEIPPDCVVPTFPGFLRRRSSPPSTHQPRESLLDVSGNALSSLIHAAIINFFFISFSIRSFRAIFVFAHLFIFGSVIIPLHGANILATLAPIRISVIIGLDNIHNLSTPSHQ